MKLLTTGNPKIAKSVKFGYLTAVLHLAPATASGYQVCPMAELAGCINACLNTAGRGGIAPGRRTFSAPGGQVLPDNAIQHCRIRRTELFFEDQRTFMDKLCNELVLFQRKALRLDLKPAVRLNGTSDIDWMKIQAYDMNLFDRFGHIQFYDYTKISKYFTRDLPDNYHLCMSWSGASEKYQLMAQHAAAAHQAPLIIVYKDPASRDYLAHQAGMLQRPVIDGDLHDLRFLDPAGAWVLLKAKGRARQDTSGFVFDVNQHAAALAA